jgi:DNA polymerase-4
MPSKVINTNFNLQPSTYLHLDLNSCFATIEQQANPLLRGKPIAVAAYTTPRGCILAPSIEAKKYGVKVGMRVMDGKKICPQLIILSSDPSKYRFINKALFKLLNQYSDQLTVKSIDEILLNFANTPIFARKTLTEIGKEIKQRIKQEIGEWLTVSVGISTNAYLAKLAAGLHKPDGLDEINAQNILNILSGISLTDLPYIKMHNAQRLNSVGIKTPVDFYFAKIQTLKAAFTSINGYYWYLRLHGQEIDNVATTRKTIGHSYALPKPTKDFTLLSQIVYKLTEKMGRRLRKNNLTAQGIHLALNYSDHSFWHQGHKIQQQMYATNDLYNETLNLLKTVQLKPVVIISVSCFFLNQDLYNQLTLFQNENRKRLLAQALDKINDLWGEFTITQGLTLKMPYQILDRISFGSVMDIPKAIINNDSLWQRETYSD